MKLATKHPSLVGLLSSECERQSQAVCGPIKLVLACALLQLLPAYLVLVRRLPAAGDLQGSKQIAVRYSTLTCDTSVTFRHRSLSANVNMPLALDVKE